jgi:hypothetical protein
VDLGKAWNLDTELQHAADAGALAGVTQLDGTDGARVRAIQAVNSELANNQQRFSNDSVDADSSGAPDGGDIEFDTTITIDGAGKANNRDIKFYTVLPIDAANEATTDAEARFIEVTVWPRTATFSFAAVVGAVTSASPSARAVAGWESLFCDSPPMMMCNPNEDPGGEEDALFNIYASCPDDGDGNTSCVGRGITMKARAGAPEPGDFGYLALKTVLEDGTIQTVTGVPDLLEALASVEFANICTGNQVTTEPGNMASLDQGINQRFDLYPDLATATDANRQPAPNVGRGLITKTTFNPGNGKCKFSPQTPADPGDWEHPENAITGEREYYRGPGKHQMVDVSPADGIPDVSPFDPSMGEVTLPIRAMAYPKDACNYLPVDTDEAIYGPIRGGGPAGCLFKVPPGNPGVDEGRQMGTGQWDIQIYLDVYHPGMTAADFLDADDPDNYADAPNSISPPIGPDGRISRWELYNWEKKSEGGTYPNMAFEEEPVCYRAGEVFPDAYILPETPAGANTPDRRILVMAVVNCAAMGGGRRTVDRTKPDGNVAVFLTEPMGYTVPDTLFGELVDPLGLGIGDVDTNPTLIRERIVLIE